MSPGNDDQRGNRNTPFAYGDNAGNSERTRAKFDQHHPPHRQGGCFETPAVPRKNKPITPRTPLVQTFFSAHTGLCLSDWLSSCYCARMFLRSVSDRSCISESISHAFNRHLACKFWSINTQPSSHWLHDATQTSDPKIKHGVPDFFTSLSMLDDAQLCRSNVHSDSAVGTPLVRGRDGVATQT